MSDKAKTKRNIIIMLAFALIVLLFGSEFLVRGCATMQKVAVPKLKSEEFSSYKKYFGANAQKSSDYILDQLTAKGRDVLFMGDTFAFSQNINFIRELIPSLYAKGITSLGIDFALYADQPEIDKLLSAKTYDEQTVYRLLFNRFVLWGYQEYADLFKAAWSFNQSLSSGAKPFRILGLAMKENWQYIQTTKDQEDLATLKKVYAEGLQDDYMFGVIQKELVAKNEKAIIYCNIQQALLHHLIKQFAESYKQIGLNYKGSAARQVYEAIGERCGTVLFDVPWPAKNNPAQPVFPAEGYFAFLLKELPAEKQSAGFDITGSPFGKIQLKNSFFAGDKETVLLQDLCSGYLLSGPIKHYTPATPIPGFINAANLEAARQNFPGPKDPAVTVDKLNQDIEYNTKKLSELLNLFE